MPRSVLIVLGAVTILTTLVSGQNSVPEIVSPETSHILPSPSGARSVPDEVLVQFKASTSAADDPKRSASSGEFVGKYFFADFCSGWIRRLDPATNTATGFVEGLSFPVDLQVGPDGNLYYLVRGGGGAVFKIISS